MPNAGQNLTKSDVGRHFPTNQSAGMSKRRRIKDCRDPGSGSDFDFFNYPFPTADSKLRSVAHIRIGKKYQQLRKGLSAEEKGTIWGLLTAFFTGCIRVPFAWTNNIATEFGSGGFYDSFQLLLSSIFSTESHTFESNLEISISLLFLGGLLLAVDWLSVCLLWLQACS